MNQVSRSAVTDRRCNRIPKGFHHLAQGCVDALPWVNRPLNIFQPQRGCIAVSRAGLQLLQS